MIKTKHLAGVIMFFAVLFASLLFFDKQVRAEDYLLGTLEISYSSGSGQLTARYNGPDRLSSSATYIWYRDGGSVATGVSNTYSPDSTGTYRCELIDGDYYNSLISSSVSLYTVTGTNINLSNSKGLYRAGERVTVSVTLNADEKVSKWSSNVNGLNISSTDSTASFTMPSSNVTLTVEKKSYHSIKVIGGTADKYTAASGEIVTVTASTVSGKTFSHWSGQGVNISNANNKIAQITMPQSNIVVTATFLTPEEKKAQDPSTVSPEEDYADAVKARFTLVRSNNYIVNVEHHSQGPLCDALFKMCLAGDTLVLDYFNITVNNSYGVLETPTPVGICLHIPADLQVGGRNWRMLGVSRGRVYSYPDCDEDDTTITFFPDHFYAFAMCYNDRVEEEIVEEEPVEEEVIEEETIEEPVIEEEIVPASTAHSSSESRTMGSTSHTSDESRSLPTYEYNMDTSQTEYYAPTPKAKINSDRKSSVRMSNGAQVGVVNI